MQRIVETLLFYHPAVWWLSNRLCSERELCCDELAVKATGERLTYASALEKAARARLFGKQPALTVGLGQSRPMLSRVRHILGFASTQQNSRFWIAGIITVLLLAALTILTASALTAKARQKADVQVEGEQTKPPVWVALLPRSPIRSAKELYLYFWGSPLVPGQAKIDSLELEIRSARDNIRMARINCESMIIVHTDKGEVLRWSMFRDGLRENMIRRIGPLEDGEYLIAIYVNGIRCSNVARFTVDSGFDGGDEPTLQVAPLVPAPRKKLQYFGLRAIGPAPQDPKFTNYTLHFPDLIVDGELRKRPEGPWSGPVYPLKPGQQHEEILQLQYYKPEIDLSREHTVKAIVGKYESAPVLIGFDRFLELAWDKATATVKSRPPQRPVLKGRVIGPDGKPGVGYRVRLYAGPRRNQFIEYSDEKGKYDFPNVPTGTYQLTCQPKGKSEPALEFEQFHIKADETKVEELSLQGKYTFSGNVTYEDGNPATGVKIVGRWEIAEGNVFRDLKVTDENGYYKLTAPFELAEYIGLSIFTPDGVPAQGSYEHMRVRGSRTDIDFVVKRKEAHAAIWPQRFARMGGKHPGFQPVPVPKGWNQTRLLEALYKYLKAQGEAKLPGCRATLKNDVIELSSNTCNYNVIRPGNAKRTGMQRNNDRGIGPEPDGLILTVHLSNATDQFDRPHIIDRSPWTGFVSQVYMPDIKLYLKMDIQYGTRLDKQLLTDLCAPTRWLKAIFATSANSTREQDAQTDVEKEGAEAGPIAKAMEPLPAQNSFQGITVSIKAKKSVYEPGSLFEIVGTIGTDREHTMYNAYWDLKKPVPGRLFVYDEAGNQILEFYDPRHHIGSSTGATKSACRKYKPGETQQIFLRQCLLFDRSAACPLPPGHYKVQLALNGLLLWEPREYVAHDEVPQDLDRQMVAYSNVVHIEIKGEPVFRGKTLTQWIEALESGDISVRKHAVDAMCSLGPVPNSAVPVLIEALRDESEEVRSRICYALGEIGPEAASSVPSLIMALKDEYWFVRSGAAMALGKIGDKRAVEPLITCLKDSDYMVRKSAAQSLGNLGDIRALEPLKAAVKDSDRELRKTAAWALEQVKPATRPQLEQHVWEQLVAMVSEADLVFIAIKEQQIDNRFEIKKILKGSGHGLFEDLEKIDGMDMPPADETKQWILFLRVEREHGRRLYPLVPTGWFVSYSKGLAQKILEAIPSPTRWGPAESGLRMGLRMRKSHVALGEDIPVEIHIQNVDKKNITLYQHLMPMYGYHPYTNFEVVTPDEKRWKLVKSIGPMNEYDFTPALELSPGETYIHTVRLNKWAVEREPLKPGEEFNLFRTGTYKVTCTHSVGEKPDYVHPRRPPKNAWSGTLTSSPLELRVMPAKDASVTSPPQTERGEREQFGALTSKADLIVVAENPWQYDRLYARQVLKGSKVSFSNIQEIDGIEKPPTDKNKQWILFLRIEQDHNLLLSPVTPGGWFAPYSEKLAQRVVAAIPLPETWGETRDGLRMGLRLRKSNFDVGEDIPVEICIQNVSKKAVTLYQHRYNNREYDYYPFTRLVVEFSDGRRLELYKPTLCMSDSDSPSPRTLSPGETYIHTVCLNKWTDWYEPAPKPSEKAELFTPGTFRITCTYSVGKKPPMVPEPAQPENAWFGTLTSAPIKLKIIEAKDASAATQPTVTERYVLNDMPGEPITIPSFGGGSGEPSDPYLIYTTEQFNTIGLIRCIWDKHFLLCANIDLAGFTGTSFNIIGTDFDNPFTGVFDGNGHKISNFSYTSSDTDSVGLFGYVTGEINNFGLIYPYVDAGTCGGVGSLVGWLINGTINACYAEEASVSGRYWVGGLVGRNGGTITNCYSTASVSGTGWDAGGLVGQNDATISNCYSTVSVSGNKYVGGLLGENCGIIIDCYSEGVVSGTTNVGGLAGRNYYGIISNSYSTASVSGKTNVGGLMGANYGEVICSFWDIETSGQTTSAGGTGKTTAEMQTISTFTGAGWDFVGETVNGTEDIWFIPQQGYPRLWWQTGHGRLSTTGQKASDPNRLKSAEDSFAMLSASLTNCWHDARVVHDVAAFRFNQIWKEPDRMWVLMRITPSNSSGNGYTRKGGHGVIMIGGSWKLIAALTKAPDRRSGRYRWEEPFKGWIRNISIKDLYTIVRQKEGGSIICRYNPKARGADQFASVCLIPRQWEEYAGPALTYLQKNLERLRQKSPQVTKDLRVLLDHKNPFVAVTACNLLAERNGLDQDFARGPLAGAKGYRQAIFTYLLLTHPLRMKQDQWFKELSRVIETAGNSKQLEGVALGISSSFFSAQVSSRSGREAKLKLLERLDKKQLKFGSQTESDKYIISILESLQIRQKEQAPNKEKKNQ